MWRNILRLIHKKVGHYHATNACEHMRTIKRQDVEQKIIKTNKGGHEVKFALLLVDSTLPDYEMIET